MKPCEILNNHSLKRTSCREGILEVMLKAKKALSEVEIRESLTGNYDRTTFYRSFKTLEEYKIIHKIVIDSQAVKYAIGNPAIPNKEHVHFYCNDCHTVQCIETMSVTDIKLPNGYTPNEVEVLIKGTCAFCKK